MKQLSLLILLVFISTLSYAQFEYQKGYFIDTANVRTECFIANEYWSKSPTQFTYKFSDIDNPLYLIVYACKEFGIYNKCRFISAKVQIDESGDVMGQYSTSKEPNWKLNHVFLKVIQEGHATLYLYEKQTMYRFFYSVADNNIQQLVYKKYMIDEYSLGTNSEYIQQLHKNVRASTNTIDDFKNLSYSATSLNSYFKNYNSNFSDTIRMYSNPKETIDNKNNSKDSIRSVVNKNWKYNNNFFVGVANVLFTYQLDSYSYNPYNRYYFGYKKSNYVALSFGMESELFLLFVKNKMSVLAQPRCNIYRTKFNFSGYNGVFNYNALTIPLGLRYNFIFNNTNRIYFSYLYTTPIGLQIHSNLVFNEVDSYPIKIQTGSTFEFGMDYYNWSLKYTAFSYDKTKTKRTEGFKTYTEDFLHFGLLNMLTVGYKISDK